MDKKSIVALVVIILLLIGNVLIIFFKVFKKDTYVVTFNSNGGTAITSVKVKEGNKVGKPTNPTKEGFTFANWYLGSEVYDFDLYVTESITLEAMWMDASNSFTVSFDTDGGNAIDNQVIGNGGVVAMPETPLKENFTFVKWQLNGTDYDFNTKVTGNITLKAIWQEVIKYNVTFDTDGGSKVEMQSVIADSMVGKPTDPTKKDFKFISWQLDGKDYDFESKVTKDITLKATWEEVQESIKYNVSFDSNGGSTIKAQSILENGKVTKPSDPTKEGYTFISWQLDNKNYDFNTKVTKDITLKAIWEKNIVIYNVIFNTDGGNSITTKKVTEGNMVSKPEDPIKEGYTFVSWQLDGTNYDFNTKITKDITLVAVWTKD